MPSKIKNDFNFKNFIGKMMDFSSRQLEGEIKAADFLVNLLRANKINFYCQYFDASVPRIKNSILRADNRTIESAGCSMASGRISGKENIISSLISTLCSPREKGNINFNPECVGISLSNFYFCPAIAVSRRSLPLIFKAKKVQSEVRVERAKYRTRNILLGNVSNPLSVSFAHYDSIGKGAIDNASGVAVLLAAVLFQSKLLEQNLFVLSANEELSYDQPIYWGHGYREFEKKYYNLLNRAKKIIVLDCLGNGPAEIIKDAEFLTQGFPVRRLEQWKKKIIILSGDYAQLMTVYHSNLDDGRGIKTKYLIQARDLLIKKVESGN